MITAPVASGSGVYGGGGASPSGTVAVTTTAIDSVTIAKVRFFAQGTSTAVPYMVQWDTTKVANGSVALTATATDIDGNVGTSVTDTVTVSN